jgi:HK97 family phage major capsid protein
MLQQRGLSRPVISLVQKSAAAALDTATGPGTGARQLEAAFLQAVARRSVLGRLGAVRVSGVASVTLEATAPTAHCIGEAAVKPVSSFTFAAASLSARKLAAQVALSRELAELATPDALGIVQRALVTASASALDVALLDPTSAAIPGVRPASLTNGVTGITPAGDFQNQIGQVFAAVSDGAPSRPVLVVPLQTALRLTGLRDLEAAGVRVLVSPAAENRLIAVDADRVVTIDEGVEIRLGTPDIQMDDAPDDPAIASTVLASTWQRNLQVVRVEHWCNWTKAPDAVAFLTLA